jgi:hypothetical protein
MEPQPNNRPARETPPYENWVAFIPDEEWAAIDTAMCKMKQVQEKFHEIRGEVEFNH